MSFKRLHCDLALKQEVIVYAKRHGIRAAGCNLVLLKQVSVIGAMTVIPFFFFFIFFRKTKCFTGYRTQERKRKLS